MAAILLIAALRGGLEGLAAQGATERPRRRTGRYVAQGSEEATQQMRLFQQIASGEVAAWYVVLYSALRFALEYLRGDQHLIYFLTLPQWISLLLFLFAAGFLKALRAPVHENKN